MAGQDGQPSALSLSISHSPTLSLSLTLALGKTVSPTCLSLHPQARFLALPPPCGQASVGFCDTCNEAYNEAFCLAAGPYGGPCVHAWCPGKVDTQWTGPPVPPPGAPPGALPGAPQGAAVQKASAECHIQN